MIPGQARFSAAAAVAVQAGRDTGRVGHGLAGTERSSGRTLCVTLQAGGVLTTRVIGGHSAEPGRVAAETVAEAGDGVRDLRGADRGRVLLVAGLAGVATRPASSAGRPAYPRRGSLNRLSSEDQVRDGLAVLERQGRRTRLGAWQNWQVSFVRPSCVGSGAACSPDA